MPNPEGFQDELETSTEGDTATATLEAPVELDASVTGTVEELLEAVE